MEDTQPTVMQEFESICKSFGHAAPFDKPATIAQLVTGSAIAYALQDVADAIWNMIPRDDDEDSPTALPGGVRAFTVDELVDATTPNSDGDYLDVETMAAAEGGILVRLNAEQVDLLLSHAACKEDAGCVKQDI